MNATIESEWGVHTEGEVFHGTSKYVQRWQIIVQDLQGQFKHSINVHVFV